MSGAWSWWKAGADVAELRARQGAREPARGPADERGACRSRPRPRWAATRPTSRPAAAPTTAPPRAPRTGPGPHAGRGPRRAADPLRAGAQNPQPSRQVALERGRSAAGGDGLANQVRRIPRGPRSPRVRGQQRGLDQDAAHDQLRAPKRQVERRHGAQPGADQHGRRRVALGQDRRPQLRLLAHGGARIGLRRGATAPAGPVIGDHASHRGEQVGQRLPDRGGRARLVQTEHRRRSRAALPGVELGYRAWRHARLATGSTRRAASAGPGALRPGSSSRAPPRDSPCRRRSPPRAPRPRRRSI